MAKETRGFQAEVKEVLDLMVHSLYSHREIFLRELISNASDALDRVRFLEAQNPDLKTSDGEKHIRLAADADAKTLTISDNGDGMTYEEVIENLGTIAHSGTKSFMAKLKEAKDSPALIGQFGVGFYAVFMVADEVEVHTRKAGTTDGVLWHSKGDGEYTIDSKERPEGNGTTITIKLKDLSQEDQPQDFTQEWTLRSIVRKYSDFIEWPIKMLVTKEEAERDDEGNPIEGKTQVTTEDVTLNSQKALWLKAPSDCSDEDYTEFYKHLTHDWNQPLANIHYKAEGTQEFSSLMFLPSQVPFDYNQRGTKYGLSLYVKRVFIMSDCEDLIPTWLRFMKGVVDSSDLPLNVSRELLQQDRQIVAIRKALVGRILKQLKTLLAKDRAKYETFWGLFGATLKEGLAEDMKDKLLDLVLFHSSHGDGWTTLKEYSERMADKQKDIYYITGDNLTSLAGSPHLEKVKQKGYEVLYLTDPVDEWVMQYVNKYDDKAIISVAKDGVDIDTEEEKKEKEATLKTQSETFKDLMTTMQEALDEHVKEVKVTDRLVDSPCCLVSGAYDPTARMERIMKSMGQEIPTSKRVLEINPEHQVIKKLKGMPKDAQKDWTEILYNQALLNEGSPIKDPQKFSVQITKLMAEVPV